MWIDLPSLVDFCSDAGVVIVTVEEWDTVSDASLLLQTTEECRDIARACAEKNLATGNALLKQVEAEMAEVSRLRQKLVERDAELAERDAVEKANLKIKDHWYRRCMDAEAKLAATEEFTRQYADRVMATNATPEQVIPRADSYRALLTVAEPTHRLGGDKAR
jgi:hypothetical protein